MIAAFFVMLRMYLPSIAEGFVNIGKSYRGLRTLSLLFARLASYFVRYFAYIVPWLALYIIGQLYSIPDPESVCSFLPVFNSLLHIFSQSVCASFD